MAAQLPAGSGGSASKLALSRHLPPWHPDPRPQNTAVSGGIGALFIPGWLTCPSVLQRAHPCAKRGAKIASPPPGSRACKSKRGLVVCTESCLARSRAAGLLALAILSIRGEDGCSLKHSETWKGAPRPAWPGEAAPSIMRLLCRAAFAGSVCAGGGKRVF